MKIRPAIAADSSAIAKIQVDSYQAENRIGQVVGYGLGGLNTDESLHFDSELIALYVRKEFNTKRSETNCTPPSATDSAKEAASPYIRGCCRRISPAGFTKNWAASSLPGSPGVTMFTSARIFGKSSTVGQTFGRL